MEQSSLQSSNSPPNQKNRRDTNGDDVEAKELADQRTIADRLLAALAGGNLDHLARAREAYLQQPSTVTNRDSGPDSLGPVECVTAIKIEAEPEIIIVETVLDSPAAPLLPIDSLAAADVIREEEEELNRAEAELERRRAEIQAARRKSEDEAKRRAFEKARRQLEIEAQIRAEEQERELVELQALRDSVHESAR